MPDHIIDTLVSNQFLEGAFFLLLQRESCLKKNGEPYVRLVLGDGRRKIKAFLWEGMDELTDDIKSGTVVKVRGSVRSFQQELSITVKKIRAATADEPGPDEFIPRIEADLEEIIVELKHLIDSIRSPYLRGLLSSFYEDETILARIKRAPAAKKLHHDAVGGLLQHTLSVTRICDFLSDHYPLLKRDLLLSAAMLHDIGKTFEFSEETLDYSTPGRLLGHLYMGAQLIETHSAVLDVTDEEMKMELLHAVLAHHGSHEWGSPTVPMTLEALALHYADNLDAKIVSFSQWIEQNPDPEKDHWSRYWNYMSRFLYHRQEDQVDEMDPSLETGNQQPEP